MRRRRLKGGAQRKSGNPNSRLARGWRQVAERWQLYVMTLPAVLYILLFHYKPMYGIVLAFKRFNMRAGIMGSEWVGFDNFERFFSSYWFPVIMKNTLTLSLLTLLLSFPVPIILALMVNEIEGRRRKHLFQTVSYAPHFISTVVVCGMITLFLSPTTGIINHVIQFFGADPVNFMQEPEMFKWIYLLSDIWQSAGWGAIIYFAALSGVDRSLLEAAEVDGANRFQRILYINLPVLIPTMITLFILRCGSLLSVGYEKIYLLQNDTNLVASEVISTYVYKMGLIESDFSFSTAVGLFNSVINSIILILANKLSKKFSGNSLW